MLSQIKADTQEESNSSSVLGIQPEKKPDPIVPTPKEWKSDKPEDAEFLKNKLNKVLEDLKAEQLKGEQKANTIVQLQEAISKSAFKSASETGDNKYELVVDSVNMITFHQSDLSKFLSIASSLKKRG